MSLEERVITAWVQLTGVLKNTRITQDLLYNEAVIMNIAYRSRETGDGLVSFKQIVSETRMLKSLVNRTIDSMVKKGYLEKIDGRDKRTIFIRVKDLDAFLQEHERTLALVKGIIDTIGEEDAEAFVRIAQKIVAADPLNNTED